MILIVGGTGTLGRELVVRMSGAGKPVRVLSRYPDQVSGLSAELVRGDVRDPSTLSSAVHGCTTVISAMHGFLGGRGAGPDAIDDAGNENLIAAATKASVERFVLLSVLDARPDHPMSLHRAKYAAEQHLAASPLRWTVLRPASYVETWIGVIGAKLSAGGPALVLGRGDNPVNFISARDVATAVDHALDDPATYRQTIDLPGPEDITMNEFGQLLGATKVRRVPRGALRLLSAAARPVAPAFARQAAAAVVMDTTDMRASTGTPHSAFPDIEWHFPTDVIRHTALNPNAP